MIRAGSVLAISGRAVYRWGTVVLAAGALAAVPAAEAAGTVTDCASYGSTGTPGTFAWALAGGGNVTFACSGTIVVDEIFITVDTTIDATGQTITLSGNNENRVLNVQSAQLDLRQVMITGGLTGGQSGGGLSAEFSTVTVTDSTLSGNSAGAGTGGGLFASSSTVTLTDSTLSGNSAGDGGGLGAISSTVTLTNCTVSDNSAAVGGGLVAWDSAVELTGSTLSGNSAAETGGGLHNGHASTATLLNSAVSGNTAANEGAGIFTEGRLLTLTASTISGNSAGRYGGGIYNRGILTLTNSTVSGNSTQYGGGGGIYNDSFGTVTLTNSTVSGNSTQYGGLGGGGIYNWSGTVTLTNSTVSGNSADHGGGISTNIADFTLINSIIAQQVQGGDCYGGHLIKSGGYNLDSDGTCELTAVGDISGGIADLQPLAINPPGPTATHALGPNSQALDVIPPAENGCDTTITTDQRGVARPQGSGCDIGAYEVVPPDVVTVTRALFTRLGKVLGVAAESTASPEAQLYVTVPNCVTNAPMEWNGSRYTYLHRVTGCGNPNGQTATVTSSYGGAATATIR